ncbi:SH3 domain-containing protein [Desulfuromonas sp. TF]|uniref:SH3 domain-containing protein n=1 Tax=Desulfuromonas sp. TF TaxID=1232410 RepID=UPI0009DEFED6|nr:SH3 domain-containing protein [Desulfuromonas sp. TF]
MMRYLLGALLPFFICGICHAEIVTVTAHTSEIFSDTSPTISQTILQAPRYYPLSVQGEKNGYFRVRDYEGRVGWIQKSQVGNTKGVVVEVARVNIRKGPGTNHPVVFKAYRGVTFQVLDEKEGWLEVKHESGQRGWVSKPLTWGR